jgi:hypothetical protein
MSKLLVATSYYNPANYASRTRLFLDFVARMANEPNVELSIAGEVGWGKYGKVLDCTQLERQPKSVMWHKESMLNLALRARSDIEHIAWMDADIAFLRPDWVEATIKALETYDVVQMFSQALDLDKNNEVYQTSPGFVYFQESLGKTLVGGRTPAGKMITPFGFAWAARRDWLEKVGGLCDTAILGSGDKHTATALYGEFDRSLPPIPLHKDYSAPWLEWQYKARDTKVGYVPGAVVHYWHGKRDDRQYDTRWEILARNTFSPKHHLIRDTDGLWKWVVGQSQLANEVAEYFRSRKEDE